jgi:hypothetical protein
MVAQPPLGASVMTRLSSLDTSDFGPHAVVIADELQVTARAGLPVVCIILAQTLVDVIANEQAGPAGYLDGIAFACAGNKVALSWLRGRRNRLLHHEGPSDGLMGEASAADWLMRDAEKAITTLLDYLEDLDVSS